MRSQWQIIALVAALAAVASGQRLYWGIVGGTGLTPDFPRYEVSGAGDVFGNPAYTFQHLPGSRSFILGGLLEVRLNDSLAIEADILHRPLRTTIVETTFPTGGPSVTTKNNYLAANTWEFPLMLKWNLPSGLVGGRVRPFVEGGVAFRTSQDVLAALPSQFGMTAGMGVAMQVGKLRIAPTLRYSRWRKETFFPPYPSKADQFEFLTSVAWGTSSDPLHMTGHRLSLGVLGGLSPNGEFYYPDSGVRVRTGYFAGLSAQLELARAFALEVDGVYKPLRNSFGEGNRFTVLTWNFPVLAKYQLPALRRALFIEAGPSFRVAGNLNGYNPSHYGATIGAGLERRARGVTVSTALRYTRWAKDAFAYTPRPGVNQDYPRTNANAMELMFGIGF